MVTKGKIATNKNHEHRDCTFFFYTSCLVVSDVDSFAYIASVLSSTQEVWLAVCLTTLSVLGV